MSALLALLLACGTLAAAGTAAPQAGPRAVRSFLLEGHGLYFRGEHEAALKSYAAALRLDPGSLEARINGGVILSELGRPRDAVAWLAKAAALPSAGADVFDALGWADLAGADLQGARRAFAEALSRSPEHGHALLGLARVELAGGRPAEALLLLDRAASASPLDTLVPYFKAKAYALLDDPAKQVESLRGAVSADSFFVEAREALALAQSRLKNFAEAWKHLSKAVDAAPKTKRLKAQLDQLRFAAPAPAKGGNPAAALSVQAAVSDLGQGKVPLLRVGIGTNMAGKPVARAAVSWSVNAPFRVRDAVTGKDLARGEPGQMWSVRRLVQKRRAVLQVSAAGLGTRLQSSRPIVIRPDDPSRSVILVDFEACVDGGRCALQADRRLRGELEIASYPAKRSLKLINRINLEDYTHGVIAMEMPIGSPLEALKAQATLARSHALHIKTVTRRHRKEGFDLCDSQHCQVYGGVGAETARSLEIARATRGMIVSYGGKPGHVIYSSNCGGRTQSGSDLTGWGGLPYWRGVSELQGSSDLPDSPWALRLWLRSIPPAYCKPSTSVHASHFRWARVLSFADLEEKLGRSRRIGRLMALRPGKRSPGGNLNSLKVIGTRGGFTITDEMALRSQLSVGSLRSTLFVLDMEYLPKPAGKGPPALIPTQAILYGGGWGHGVGMCQSGAMGRAEAGQTFQEIIKAYFHGVDISRLPY
ncbi:MAG: SpoIID/LytB domain-containing protein [Elusimicrobia bacterium]|nr:SpoIID/LytB domain-containing protein [Elusimicrobiota bacterium]